MTTPLPNLFVLGAGKCGTSTLHNVLSWHPLIHMSKPKEPSFFCSYFQVVKNPIEYFNLFKAGASARYRGESSHVYLSNPETPPVLSALFPDAKLILIVRDPAERAYSLYRHMRRHGYETEQSFSGALAIEQERLRGEYSKLPHYPWNFFYAGSSRYDLQLARYLQHYPHEQFLVMSLANLAKEPQATFNRIWQFLDVPAHDCIVPRLNHGGKSAPIDDAARNILDQELGGVMDRVDKLAGAKLDWSM